MSRIIAFVFPVLLLACPPTAVVPTTDADASTVDAGVLYDAPRFSSCHNACEVVIKFCPHEAAFENNAACEKVCEHTQETKTFDMKPACLAVARSVAEVRACGTVRCTQ